MDRIEKNISKVISVIFHPLLMPTYTLLIIFNSDTHYSYMPFEAQKILYLLVFFSTFLLPVSTIPFLINLKLITGLGLDKSKERIIPLAITAVCYLFSYYLLYRLPVSTLAFIRILIFASFVLIIVDLVITIKWKISAHLTGIGGLTGSLLFYAMYLNADFSLLIPLIILLAGLIGYSRLNLQAHTPSQIYAGYLVGIFGMFMIMLIAF
ncbi:MAG: hypothetical protein U0W24_07450 [Bacteroidales bacterium]